MEVIEEEVAKNLQFVIIVFLHCIAPYCLFTKALSFAEVWSSH